MGDVKDVYASLSFPVGGLTYDFPSAANSLGEKLGQYIVYLEVKYEF